ncbi:MAG: ZIP family metal transporter [Candidatus Diapherotrites archaeon]|uniref:ZIP family metal transporter n=1 Tax=Candidatus Iainarchaeum sp. TaxID=3101447 RepID=A0A8T3YPL6_9ARCH|nr:ZIP family metal transporter [Candidatus Diapherotrites archaeon]
MFDAWAYSIASVMAVSLVSLIGAFTLPFSQEKVRSFLIYMVSFSAGALFGDAFIHLLPEAAEEAAGFTPALAIYLISGIIISFIIEKFIRWRHCHLPTTEEHPHPLALMNLVGDGVHNFIDGLIIGGSYLLSAPVGFATTLAVIFHEIPQEIGDYGVLIHGGFTKKKALLFNFLTALTSILGAIVALAISAFVPNITTFLVPFAAGIFIYVAGTDLIPELHKEVEPSKSLAQLAWFVLGIIVMLALLLLGG